MEKKMWMGNFATLYIMKTLKMGWLSIYLKTDGTEPHKHLEGQVLKYWELRQALGLYAWHDTSIGV